jgi:8-oxo-dGTP pyrophosphatase MutT (NUDIX family)
MTNEFFLAKIACFAVRDRGTGWDLLVIRHPTAGTQVPAGTVDPREPCRSAALREFHEETGVKASSAHCVGRIEKDYPPHHGVLVATPHHSMEVVRTGVDHDLQLRRGLPVRIIAERDNEVQVIYEEWDYNLDPPVVINSVAGWVASTDVAKTIVRELYRVTVNEVTQPSWTHLADGQNWTLEWMPIQAVTLFGEQQGWLDALRDELTSAVAN